MVDIARGVKEITQPVNIEVNPTETTFQVCSMTTEMYAIYIGLSNLERILPFLERPNQEYVLLLTDSKSSMMTLQHGALQNENQMAHCIWLTISKIVEKGYKIKMMHVFSHQGIPENEAADTLASQTPKKPSKVKFVVPEDEDEELPPPPISLADMKFNFKRVIKKQWIKNLDTNTQRYALVGATITPKGNICPITLKEMTLAQLSHLRRIRCGHSELFGRVKWGIYDLPPVCRFCYGIIKPKGKKHSEILGEEDPLLEPDPEPPDKEDRLSPSILTKMKSKFKTNRTQVPCLICPRHKPKFSCLSALKTHYRKFHPHEDPPQGILHCRYCDKPWPSMASRRTHERHCNPNKISKDAPIFGPPDLRTLETIIHIEECSKAPNIENLLSLKKKHGTKWYFSLPFLKWTLEVFGEHDLIQEMQLQDIEQYIRDDCYSEADEDSSCYSEESDYSV